MTYGRRDKIERMFPWAVLALFRLIRFAPVLHLTHLGLPDPTYVIFDSQGIDAVAKRLLIAKHAMLAVYFLLATFLFVTISSLLVITAVFLTVGGLVGEYLKNFSPLRGYGINLVGSMAGIVAFTFLSFLATQPFAWLLIGFPLLMPFFWRKPAVIAAFICIVLMHLVPERNTFWLQLHSTK